MKFKIPKQVTVARSNCILDQLLSHRKAQGIYNCSGVSDSATECFETTPSKYTKYKRDWQVNSCDRIFTISRGIHCVHLQLHCRKKGSSIHYSYRKCITHARMFSQTLAHWHSKNEIRQSNIIYYYYFKLLNLFRQQ